MSTPTGIPPQYQEKYAIISDMIVSYCESRFDEEFTDICLHALQKLCRKRTEPMAAGRNNMWAAGIIYAIAQNCNMIGNNGNTLLNEFEDEYCAKLLGDNWHDHLLGAYKEFKKNNAKKDKKEDDLKAEFEDQSLTDFYDAMDYVFRYGFGTESKTSESVLSGFTGLLFGKECIMPSARTVPLRRKKAGVQPSPRVPTREPKSQHATARG